MAMGMEEADQGGAFRELFDLGRRRRGDADHDVGLGIDVRGVQHLGVGVGRVGEPGGGAGVLLDLHAEAHLPESRRHRRIQCDPALAARVFLRNR
jgi:hypothetical protein